ncbi:protein PIP-1-like [Marmota marmota marmota]|uniref:protein PIP-1-like n=1 Tax=Marmota marmota marmota TaxID=9994 RepID=UPI000762A84B|nr:protein PIP-1-like [Marmota marmota marmota]XP_027801252.1 secreted seminal-vesicle Ly-6 protein 1-like [Marmota flaviventris]
MGKHLLLLLLLLGLSLLWGNLQALTCVQCPRITAKGICKSEKSSCQAHGSQQCFLRKVYEGDRFLYGYQGCSDLCIPMSFFNRNIKVDLMCCSNTSFCNRL